MLPFAAAAPIPRRRPRLLNPGYGRRAPPEPLWGKQINIILCILALVFIGKIVSVFNTVLLTCDERGGFFCRNTATVEIRGDDAPEVGTGVIKGRDIPMHCEGPPEGSCGVHVVDGVCVVRSCAEGQAGAEAGAVITSLPSEEMAGTPTVDKSSSWWWDTKSVLDAGGAECTGSCGSDADAKTGVKRQQYIGGFGLGLGLQPTPRPSTKQNAPASTTTSQHPNSTQTGDIPLQTNIESGEPRGVVWNSCTTSAVLLGLVAFGVVVLL